MPVATEMCDIGDETNDKEVDVIGLGCSKEVFSEHEEVKNLIDELKASAQSQSANADFRQLERNWQRYSFILDQYQEQPHLLDSHLDDILLKIISITREDSLSLDVKHIAFRCLYFLAKVRGYKVVARHLPHETADLEPLLKYLESQVGKGAEKWETQYGLLLWFSIVIKIPFHLQRFDTSSSEPVMQRILDTCKSYLAVTSKAQDMACYVTSIYITRPDVLHNYLPGFIGWIQEVLVNDNPAHFKRGVILTLAGVFKHGQREHLLALAPNILKSILSVQFTASELFIVRKAVVKLMQRIGMIFLKPRVASWRYQRGSRSLALNLVHSGQRVTQLQAGSQDQDDEEEEDFDIPDEIEEVIEDILKGLRDKNRDVQYSAAKGIGRLTNRLPKDYADQVVESVMELFSLKESDMAWHGGCLALAELARRGLLLPQRLSELLPFIEQALLYDELRGNFSVGSAVRDAACYLCWALARAYDPSILQPFVHQLAKSLVVTTVFDREVNCRRAAASAFQEHVGRQGTFPHGIDILTTCDYFAVGLRKNAYLNLSVFVAQFDEYRPFLIQHLVDRKIMHWDTVIRELSSQALHKLTFLDPLLMKTILVERILPNCTKIELYLRHGSILAAGQIINALCKIASASQSKASEYLDEKLVELIVKTGGDIMEERLWRSLGGDQMRIAVSHFIQDLSQGHFPVPEVLVDRWFGALKDCLASVDSTVQQSAVRAISALVSEYFIGKSSAEIVELLQRFLAECTGNNQQARVGNALALGSMPRFVIVSNLSAVIDSLCSCASITEKTAQWAEARKSSLASLAAVCSVVGLSPIHQALDGIDEALLSQVFKTLMNALDDYTVDSRGDIGAIVRESAMSSLQTVVELTNKSRPELLQPNLVRPILHALAKQATEQIRRTRLLAADVFASLLYCEPAIPSVDQREELCAIVPRPPVDFSTEKELFELWVKVMRLDSYRLAIISGLVSSIGSLTESLVKSASASFTGHIRSLTAEGRLDELRAIADDILAIFKANLGNARMMPYIFNFIDHLASSGCLDPVFKDISSDLLNLVRSEMTSGSKPLKLLISSIDLYCHLLRGDAATFDKSVTHLLNLLVSRFPRVRKITATKLYEALLTLTDVDDDLAGRQDEILAVLSDTDWDEDVEKLKPIKTQLRQLFIPSANQ